MRGGGGGVLQPLQNCRDADSENCDRFYEDVPIHSRVIVIDSENRLL